MLNFKYIIFKNYFNLKFIKDSIYIMLNFKYIIFKNYFNLKFIKDSILLKACSRISKGGNITPRK